MRLHVLAALERSQECDQFFFVARGHQRGDQDDVRNPCADSGHCRVAGVDLDEFRADLVPDDALEDCGLTAVRFNRQDE